MLWECPALVETRIQHIDVFRDGAARVEVLWFCTACHSSELVRRQGLTRDRWDDLLTWMTDRHGMAPLEGTDRTKFLDYLSEALPPKPARGFVNPFLNRQ